MSEEKTYPEIWSTFIESFATAIGMSVDDVTEKLETLVGEPGQDAIDALASEEYAPFDDIRSVLADVPLAKLRKAVAETLRAQEQVSVTDVEAAVATPSLEILPAVPDDDAWLTTLKTGGELKVNQTTVISAMRAALASRSGLYDLPKQLVELMERHFESLEEPVSDDYYKLRNLLVRRSYADIFAALDVDGQFVTEGRKQRLLTRLDQGLWPALFSFHQQLKGWMDSWQQGAANPGAMFAALAAMGSGGAAMPPGMMQPPETDTLRDGAESVNDDINRVFSGTGIPVAMALGYDAQRVKEVLQNSSLPAQIGAANREQMLKMLRANVSPDYVRLERNIIRYALAVMDYPKVSAGNEEHMYLGSLLMLGNSIPWDKLSTGGAASSDVQYRSRSQFDDEVR